MVTKKGCYNDDKIVLGGRREFLNHFCTLFNFNVCHARYEDKSSKRMANRFNDPEELNSSIEDFMKRMDEIK